MIGTYNVAGKSPSSEIDLSEWLCTEEPADMYILGWENALPLAKKKKKWKNPLPLLCHKLCNQWTFDQRKQGTIDLKHQVQMTKETGTKPTGTGIYPRCQLTLLVTGVYRHRLLLIFCYSCL